MTTLEAKTSEAASTGSGTHPLDRLSAEAVRLSGSARA
jgi:hypothetical protein